MIRVPRLRHVAGSEIPLRSYEALHGERAVNDLLLKRVLYRHLPTLRVALKRELKIDTTTSKKNAA